MKQNIQLKPITQFKLIIQLTQLILVQRKVNLNENTEIFICEINP